MATFGELLGYFRVRAGLSQADVSLRIGRERHYLSALERDYRGVSRERRTVLDVAEALGCSAAQRDQLLIAAGYAPAWLAPAAEDDQLLYRLWAEAGIHRPPPRRPVLHRRCTDCGQPGQLRRGYCQRHYMERWRRGEFRRRQQVA